MSWSYLREEMLSWDSWSGKDTLQVGVDSMGAGLGHQECWTAVWGESGLLAGRVTKSWTCPKAPTLQSHLFSCRFIYELEHFNGVAELLEILGR